MKGCLLVILLCLPVTAIFSQTRAIDSMRSKIYSAAAPALKKQMLLEALQSQRSLNLDTLYSYVAQADGIRPHTPEAALEIGEARAYYYLRMGKTDSAQAVVDKGLRALAGFGGRIPVRLQMIFGLLHGSIHLRKNDLKLALDDFFTVLSQAERSRSEALQIRALNGIGWVYMEMVQYEEAIKWFRKALAVPRRLARANNFCPVYSNLASCYGALSISDSAHRYVEEALAFSMQYEDFTSEANSLVIKANIVMAEGRYPEAITLLKQTITLRKMLKDPYYVLSDLCILSNIYASMGRTNEALAAANEAMMIARRYDIRAKLPMIYTSFETIYARSKDYEKLARTYEEHLAIKDSVYRKNLEEELADREAWYETDKKEREITRQNLVIQHQRDRAQVTLFSLSGLIVLIGAGGLIYVQRYKAGQQKERFRSMLEAEQRERMRIARDLHDSIGQMLSVVKMNVSNIHYQAPPDEQAATANTLAIVDRTIQEVRHISHNLIPEELDFGIANALEELCRKINEAGETRIKLDLPDDIGSQEWDKPFALSLYRIVQELLANMLKHARAKQIQLSLTQKEDTLMLIVADNGIGFDTNMLKDARGLGWKNIRARVQLLNGRMAIQSEQTNGTQITIVIPLCTTKKECRS
ncbi:ATP-binding protein [Taibaiella koreensis]|uniref:ATP-binding protein n=1 Tax=Taibaiella koreensis TaxID=1268548 RepID=UPI000E59921C|nr:ATP-binding protein [Taibaiella koreensis]